MASGRFAALNHQATTNRLGGGAEPTPTPRAPLMSWTVVLGEDGQ